MADFYNKSAIFIHYNLIIQKEYETKWSKNGSVRAYLVICR